MENNITSNKAAWLQARLTLLQKEKAHVQAGDDLAALRRSMPKFRLTNEYEFEGVDGKVSLSQLFGRHSQLIIQHFMFSPDWQAGCPSCSFWADGIEPVVIHLNQRDVSFVAVSRAPLAILAQYKQRMGWSFPWVSSANNEFNFDFAVAPSPDEEKTGTMQYNYEDTKVGSAEFPGMSVFSRDSDDNVYHCYSTYARGLDHLNAAYAYLDLTPKGRNENDLAWPMAWVKRHDEYGSGT